MGLWIFMNHSPKNINKFVGYRTPASMKNKATWEFSHHYFGCIFPTEKALRNNFDKDGNRVK